LRVRAGRFFLAAMGLQLLRRAAQSSDGARSRDPCAVEAVTTPAEA
jgi:hypothetical protein